MKNNRSPLDAYRLLSIGYILIWLIPVKTILSHTSSNGVIFGVYEPDYFVLVIIYCLGLGALIVLFTLRPSLARILRVISGLQHRPWLLGLMIYSFLELWYLVRDVLKNRPLFFSGDWVVYIGMIPGDRELVPIMVFLGLLLAYSAMLLLFVGRESEACRRVIADGTLLLISFVLSFTLFAYGYVALIEPYTGYMSNHAFWIDLHQYDADLVFTPRPNIEGAQMYQLDEDHFVTISTNDQGLRNRTDVSGAPLAVLGDSFMFGLPLSDDEVWTNTFETIMGFEPANYGVARYAFWQYNRVAETRFKDGQYDMVVYAIFANDLYDDTLYEQNPRLLQLWELAPLRTPLSYVANKVLSRSPLQHLIGWLGTVGRDSGPPSPEEKLPNGLVKMCTPHENKVVAMPDDYLIRQIDRAISLSEQKDYRLLFVMIPSKEAVYDELVAVCSPSVQVEVRKEQEDYRAMCQYLDEQGIACYNMSGDFRLAAQNEGGLIYLPSDGHWNARGQAVFAELLSQYIVEHHLLQ